MGQDGSTNFDDCELVGRREDAEISLDFALRPQLIEQIYQDLLQRRKCFIDVSEKRNADSILVSAKGMRNLLYHRYHHAGK